MSISRRSRRPARCIVVVAAVGLALTALPVAASAATAGRISASKTTNVIVQGGTTPTDSGLLQNVIEPGFKKMYPQYNLQYVSVGTGQAITNAENGEADAVFTHSATLENSFVASGYSYEPGGRLVMSSDFVTVGANSDPAGVLTGPSHDVVAAFTEIATAGKAGRADFVSRGDQSGTNTKELAIWALTGIPRNTLGEPGTPGTTTVDSWYHTTGDGQGLNLQVTDQCPFSSGACYTLADRGTFNELVSEGTLPDLTIVSQDNDGPTAVGGTSLLANPYHAYAVNPQKEPGVHINLAGALAFLNYLTSPSTQAAIGAYPTPSTPAFFPDARPIVTITHGVPAKATAGASATITGTAKPGYSLDPSIAGAPVLLVRNGDQSTTLANTTLASDGTFSLTFTPTRTDTYIVYLPQYTDGIVEPTNTSYRQAESVSAGKLVLTAAVTLNVTGQSGDTVQLDGTGAPATDRINATVQIQGKNHSGWQVLGSPIDLPDGQTTYSTSVLLPSGGTWQLRARYMDHGAVKDGVSAISQVSAP